MAFTHHVQLAFHVCNQGLKPLPGLGVIRLAAGLDEREFTLQLRVICAHWAPPILGRSTTRVRALQTLLGGTQKGPLLKSKGTTNHLSGWEGASTRIAKGTNRETRTFWVRGSRRPLSPLWHGRWPRQ